MKIEFLKRKKKFVKHGVVPNPNIYWMAVFWGGFVFTIVAFAFGLYVFLKVNKENVLPAPVPSKQLEKISKERMDKVLEIFSEREKNRDEILANPPPVVDPSL